MSRRIRIRRHLRGGFPWDAPELDHLQLSTPDLWWDSLAPFLRRSLEAVGVPDDLSDAAVKKLRSSYCNPMCFQLYPDSTEALTRLKEAGWRLVILSNHVPELPFITEGLGLSPLVDDVFTSGLTGYEKPNPAAFQIALGDARPGECFMVGDNPQADILGALRAGLRGILVRNEDPGVPWSARDSQRSG